MSWTWHSEQPLSVERVRAILAEQFPSLALDRVDFLNEGCDSRVYLVDGSWIFRFPKREDVVPSLETETALLPVLAPRLSLPVPRFEHLGRPSALFPWRFVGYRMLEGEPAIGTFDEPEGAAEALGVFLAKLHAFPALEAKKLGVRGELSCELEPYRTEGLERLPRVAGVMTRERFSQCESLLARPAPEPGGRPVLVHADVRAEHILVARGRIAGIIDWGDVSLGDPAIDLAGAFHWLGESFFRRVLESYGGPADLGVPERARYVAICMAVNDCYYGVETGRSEYVTVGKSALEHCLD